MAVKGHSLGGMIWAAGSRGRLQPRGAHGAATPSLAFTLGTERAALHCLAFNQTRELLWERVAGEDQSFWSFYPHFIDKETESLGGQETCQNLSDSWCLSLPST